MFKILATHVSLDVEDLAATQKYLEDVCGFEKLRQVTRPDFTVVWYPGLELWQAGPDATPGIAKHVAWQVDDIDEAVRELKERGVNFDFEEPKQIDPAAVDTGEIVRYMFFSTPVGLQGEIYEVKPPRNG